MGTGTSRAREHLTGLYLDGSWVTPYMIGTVLTIIRGSCPPEQIGAQKHVKSLRMVTIGVVKTLQTYSCTLSYFSEVLLSFGILFYTIPRKVFIFSFLMLN